MKKKNDGLNSLQSELNKKFGQGSLMTLNSETRFDENAISTGSLRLNHALGIGGYPRGRLIEIYGPESSGKTTLTLHAIAEVQRNGGTAAFIDAEHAFDPRYAEALGVDLKTLLVSQPDCGEQGLDIASALSESGKVDLIVIDSVAALVPKAEIDGDMGDHHVGLHARLMSRAARRITGEANRTQTTVIFINQLRQKIGVLFGNPETTTGGNALKFFASIRLDVRRIGKVTSGDDVIGNKTRVKVIKNKLASPFSEAEFEIRFGQGIDRLGEVFDEGVAQGLIKKSGSYYSFSEVSLGQGREKARTALKASSTMQQELERQLWSPKASGSPTETNHGRPEAPKKASKQVPSRTRAA